MRLICLGAVISQVMLGSLRAVVVLTTIATGFLTAWNASADERDAALDAVIPAAMQKGSIPGAMVGIWQDGPRTVRADLRRAQLGDTRADGN
jgi:D-alanyl-D-alanine carboxypeptidase